MTAKRSALETGFTVRDLMRTAVVTVVREMTVRELAQLFAEKRISGAPVLDREGKLVGVVSATDVMQLVAREAEISSGQVDWSTGLLAEEREEDDGFRVGGAVHFTLADPGARAETGLDQHCVADIMTPVAFALHPSDSLRDALRFFVGGRVHRALVMENDQLLGILTPFDVMRALDGLVSDAEGARTDFQPAPRPLGEGSIDPAPAYPA